MDFDFTTEQRLLRDSARSFLADKRRDVATRWNDFAGMGWLAMPFAECDGGLGAGPIETMILMQELGRANVVSPFVTNAILAGELLRRCDQNRVKATRIAALMSGQAQWAVAYAEKPSRYTINHIETTAVASDDGWLLNGEKTVVIDGNSANNFIVAARTAGKVFEVHGVSLFAIPADTNGLVRSAYPLVDSGCGADITLQHVRAPKSALLGALHEGTALLTGAIDFATAAIGAEALGCIDALLEQTIEYTNTRKQFGKSVATFQVIQHRLVDMFMEIEQVRSLVYLAAIRLAEKNPTAAQAVSAMKAMVGKAGRLVGQEAIQMHGGMGMTNDLAIGRYFKRLLAIDAQFGNVDHHLKRFNRLRQVAA